MEEQKYIIELQNITKVFDEKKVVDNVSLKIKKGDFITLLGPSGCGKTTLLRMIAGFETATEGTILFNGRDISEVPAHKRPFNTVFQRYALFPHLDVYENIAFGLRLQRIEEQVKTKKGKIKTKKRKLKESVIENKVKRALKVVGLSGYEDRKVNSLSGGQQQRIAIARAIVNEPSVLLLDEPLAALDLKMRKEMREEIIEMHKTLGITFIYVTHDQEEALTMSDSIAVLREGKVFQEGSPINIYNEPQNIFVANFIGDSNIFNGTVFENEKVEFINEQFTCPHQGFELNQPVDIVIRPEDVEIIKKDQGVFNAKVESSFFKGMHYQITLVKDNYSFYAQTTKDEQEGSIVGINIDPDNIQIMKKERLTNIVNVSFEDNTHFTFDEATYEFNPKILFPNYQYDEEEDVLLDENNNEVDLKEKKARVSFGFNDVEMLDYEDLAPLVGNVEMAVYKGNIFEVSIITESGGRYTVYSEDVWDEGDLVALKIHKNNFQFIEFYEDKDEE